MKFVTSSVMCVVMFCAVAAWSQNRQGNTKRARDCGADCTLLKASTLPLTDQEIQDLSTIWKDEKLALDVYTALSEIYDLQVFANIAASEQRHLSAVATLLARYEVPVPEPEDTTDLVSRGSINLSEALFVGVYIEEKDIADLQEALNNTDRRDISRVYANLLNGSYNHLDAFESIHQVAAQ